MLEVFVAAAAAARKVRVVVVVEKKDASELDRLWKVDDEAQLGDGDDDDTKNNRRWNIHKARSERLWWLLST